MGNVSGKCLTEFADNTHIMFCTVVRSYRESYVEEEMTFTVGVYYERVYSLYLQTAEFECWQMIDVC